MVHLRFSDRRDGDAFLILHPRGTDSRSMEPLITELGDRYRVITPERPGHGRTPNADGDWHFEDFAADTAQLLDDLGVSHVHVLGWSDGSIEGLYLALARPDLVRSLVFGGAPFQFDSWNEGVLEETLPDFLAEAYGEVSPDGELAPVPYATHALIVEKPDLVTRLIRDFYNPNMTDGFAPQRRPNTV